VFHMPHCQAVSTCYMYKALSNNCGTLQWPQFSKEDFTYIVRVYMHLRKIIHHD